jgi:hypothetical protein
MFVSDILEDSAALLNDPIQATWKNVVLFPYYKKAHKEMVQAYENHGASILNEVSTLVTVTVGTVIITSLTDIRTPLTLWERASGSSDKFVEMEEKAWEPELDQANTLRYWVWREGAINLLGATTERQVKLLYIKQLLPPSSENSTVTIPEAELYLAARTAALAAALSGGNFERASALEADAQEAQFRILNNQAHSSQGVPIRKKGYRA